VSEDVDKICRAIFLQVITAKTLREAVNAIEIIIGAENAAIVKDTLENQKQRDKE